MNFCLLFKILCLVITFTVHSDITCTVTLHCVVLGKRYHHRCFLMMFMKAHGYVFKTSDQQKNYEIFVISKINLVILADKRCGNKTKE